MNGVDDLQEIVITAAKVPAYRQFLRDIGIYIQDDVLVHALNSKKDEDARQGKALVWELKKNKEEEARKEKEELQTAQVWSASSQKTPAQIVPNPSNGSNFTVAAFDAGHHINAAQDDDADLETLVDSRMEELGLDPECEDDRIKTRSEVKAWRN